MTRLLQAWRTPPAQTECRTLLASFIRFVAEGALA
jgi:hypothetical protein